MGLTINLVWDANALAAPASFRNSVSQAAAVLEAAIDTPVTVNVQVGYGEYDLNGPDYQALNGDYSLGGILSGVDISYDALTAALAQVASSATDTEVVDALPATASLNGQSAFEISTALAKAFGAIAATATPIDGEIGFPTSFTGTALVGVAITELMHAMGLLNAHGPESLVQYTSPGTHFLAGGTTGTPVYLSTNDGNTSLAGYATSYDSTLFENLDGDPLNFPNYGVTTLTALDTLEIGAIGFNTNDIAAPPSQSIAPAVVSGGHPSIDTRNLTIATGATIGVESFIASVTATSSAGITSYDFYGNGTDGGYFTFDGIAQPDEQFLDVLSTQLGDVDYVAGTSPGSETDQVDASDGATQEVASALFTVTTQNALCFARGTHIRTPGGDVPIEDLAIGDVVSTSAGPKPIKWLGRRHYDGDLAGKHHLILPVVIRQHAIADNCPGRDLKVSPGHGICVADDEANPYLIPAWRLVNGISIEQPKRIEGIDYLHIELDEHALLFAEGLATESFYELDGFRRQFENAGEYDRLYPGSAVPCGMCLPRLEDGFALRDIRNRLARRAGLSIAYESPSSSGFRGIVDRAHGGWVTGWAHDASQPDIPLTIAVKINGGLAAYGLANRYRNDLRDAGIGDGCHAFAFPLHPEASGKIEVCRAINGMPLSISDAARRAADPIVPGRA